MDGEDRGTSSSVHTLMALLITWDESEIGGVAHTKGCNAVTSIGGGLVFER